VTATCSSTPNAQTKVRGQLFRIDRHIGQIAVAYKGPARTTVARSSATPTGQPFTRLVIAPALTQGPVAVRSLRERRIGVHLRRHHRPARAESVHRGRAEIAAVVDVYNLPNLDNRSHRIRRQRFAVRTPTALQPPRTLVAGCAWPSKGV